MKYITNQGFLHFEPYCPLYKEIGNSFYLSKVGGLKVNLMNSSTEDVVENNSQFFFYGHDLSAILTHDFTNPFIRTRANVNVKIENIGEGNLWKISSENDTKKIDNCCKKILFPSSFFKYI